MDGGQDGRPAFQWFQLCVKKKEKLNNGTGNKTNKVDLVNFSFTEDSSFERLICFFGRFRKEMGTGYQYLALGTSSVWLMLAAGGVPQGRRMGSSEWS